MSFQTYTAANRSQKRDTRGQTTNGGRRGRSAFKSNSRPAPRPKQEYIPLLERAPHQIVGTMGWAIQQQHEALVEGRNVQNMIEQPPTVKHSQKNPVGIQNRNKKGYKEKWTKIQKHNQSKLIDQIVTYTNSNNWAMMETEDGKKWVNDRYEDRVFETGRIIEEATGEVVYFPISNTNEDPLGLALHYKISTDGASYTIYHNGFVPYGNAKERKYWRYRAKRHDILKNKKKIQDELDKEKLHAERLVKYGPERTAEMERMDTKNEKNSGGNIVNKMLASNTAPEMKTPMNSGGVSLSVKEKNDPSEEIALFSGPTPAEANKNE